MTWTDYCVARAVHCDHLGDRSQHPAAKAEWYGMARDWRVTASKPKGHEWAADMRNLNKAGLND